MFGEVDYRLYLGAVCAMPLGAVFGLLFLSADATNLLTSVPALVLLVVYLVWFLGGRRSSPRLFGVVHGLLISAVFLGGVLLGAGIGDRFPKRKVAALCMLSHAIGLLLLTYSTHMAELLAFAIFHGFAWGLRGPFMQAIRADYFGRKAIGQIMGISAAIIANGQVAGPLVAGVLADMTGNYRLGFTVLAILAGMGSLVFLRATQPEPPGALAAK